MRRFPATAAVSLIAASVFAGVLVRAQGRAGGAPQNGANLSSPPPGTAVLMGRVVEADGTTPVAGAIVTLSGGGLGNAGQAFAAANGSGPRTVQTNAVGRFLFAGLAKGSYGLNATATGYLPGSYGQDRPRSPIPRALDITRPVEIADAETKTDATVRLWRLGVISGTVVDEYNQPMVGVGVQLSAVQEIWIGRISTNSDRATTDDRGMYRAEVAPGDYIVAIGSSVTAVPARLSEEWAQAMADPSNQRALIDQLNSTGLPPPPMSGTRLDSVVVGTNRDPRLMPWLWSNGSTGPLFVYPATYYPSASLSTMATVVSVPAGVERSGVDIQLRPQPAFRISGHVVGPTGPLSGLNVSLIGADFNTKTNSQPLFSNAATTDVDGAFELVGVTPGQYTVESIKTPIARRQTSSITVTGPNGGTSSFTTVGLANPPVQEPVLWTSQAIVVSNADMSGITLSLNEAPRLSGRFEFAPSATPLTPEQIGTIGVGLRVLPGTVAGRLFGNPNLGTVTDDGVTFRTSSVLPGTYIVVANRLPVGWSLASAVTGGKDAADVPIDIGGSGVSDLVLRFTNKITTLSGAVTGDDAVAVPGLPPPSPTVVVFSTNQAFWPKVALSPRTLRSNPVGAGMRFQITGMPPGEYYVAASSSGSDFTDPKVLLFLSKAAARVTLAEGEVRTQDVHAVVVPAIK